MAPHRFHVGSPLLISRSAGRNHTAIARAWLRSLPLIALLVSSIAAAAEPAPRLLVLQKHAELLSGFDPDTGDRWGSTIRVFAIPHELAATADGNRLLITNYGVKSFRDTDAGANLITIVDPHRIAHAGTIDLGNNHRPHGIVRGRSGRFYVTTDMPAELLVVDADKRAVVEHISLDGKLPHMVAVSADERRAFVANAGSGTVSVVPIGQPPRDKSRVVNVAIGGTPMGLVLTDDGKSLYASNRDGNQIVRIDTRDLRIVERIAVAGEPSRLVLTNGGRLLVASLIAGNAVVGIDTATSREIARLPVGRRPEAVLVDSERQRGFVAAQEDDKVVEFSLTDWKVIREIPTGDHPDSMWLDRAPAPSDTAQEIDGDATKFFSDYRVFQVAPPSRAAWTRYLAASKKQRTAEQAGIDAEVHGAGKPRLVPAPYRKEFHVEPSMTPAWLASDEGRRVTATVLSFQTPAGGWSKHVDLLGRPRKPGESFYSENDGWNYIATLDNDTTTEQIRFVAAAAAATGDAAARASFGRGLDYLLAAQFPNGCWPQVYPLQGGYHDAITFNDDAVLNVMRLLDDVVSGQIKAATPDQKARAAAAATRGLGCIVATQVIEGGARTIWGQQSDPLTREPVPARRYELAGLASRESANLVAYLMTVPNPSPAIVETVHAAAAWFQAHEIHGYDYDAKHGLRPNPNGGPIWARLTELGTARPIFSNRDGVKRYDWTELTDRRYGYTWYCREPAAVLATYATWAKQHPRVR